ncbi:MAG: hypothetical protein ACXWM5_15890 [Vulcanimicrobiaceae bacterium]
MPVRAAPGPHGTLAQVEYSGKLARAAARDTHAPVAARDTRARVPRLGAGAPAGQIAPWIDRGGPPWPVSLSRRLQLLER